MRILFLWLEVKKYRINHINKEYMQADQGENTDTKESNLLASSEDTVSHMNEEDLQAGHGQNTETKESKSQVSSEDVINQIVTVCK